MNTLSAIAIQANNTGARPLPPEVEAGIATIKLWIQGIGGGIAVIGLLILFIGLMIAHRHNQGQEFMGKAGWWVTGALGFGLAGVIAPVFLGF